MSDQKVSKKEQVRWENFMLQAEATSWSRFYNFLMFTSILILAWATLFQQSGRDDFVLGAISILGLVSGIACSVLCGNSRRYQTFYMGQARDAGSPMACGTIWVRDNKLIWRLGSFYTLTITPLAISYLYGILLYVVLMHHFEGLSSTLMKYLVQRFVNPSPVFDLAGQRSWLRAS